MRGQSIGAGLQVARTYVHRVRFWLMGTVYLYIALSVTEGEPWQVFLSASVACVLACFVALHLRRQFGGPSAKVVPNFAGPHLVVGALVSLGIWVVVPAIAAWRNGLPVWGPVGAHAVAGLLLAAVVCWRQAIVLLVSLPVLLIGAQSSFVFNSYTPGYRFLAGETPWVSALVVLAAVVAHGIAALVLVRLSDRNVPVSDDFVVELSSETGSGRCNEWWNVLGDSAVRRLLADAGHGLWAVNRWRVPVSGSWSQVGFVVLVGLVLAGIAWVASGRSEAALIGAEVVAFGMLFVPLNAWHLRRGALAHELTRPVTREKFFWQIAAALAVDMALWAFAGSVLSCAVVAVVFRDEPEAWRYPIVQLVALWVVALLWYGLGLATFRMRYWLPVMVSLAALWWLITLKVILSSQALARSGVSPKLDVSFFMVSAALTSAVLTLVTIVHWRRADVT